MKLLKLKEGAKAFDYNSGPEIIHFDERGVVVDDSKVEKLTNMFPLVAIDVEEQTPVIEETVEEVSVDETPVEETVEEAPKKRRTNKK